MVTDHSSSNSNDWSPPIRQTDFSVDDFQKTFDQQSAFYQRGDTLKLEFRCQSLHRLKAALRCRETEILNALKEDLGKPPVESFSGEIGFLYSEISYVLKRLKKWIKPKSVGTPMFLFPSKSKILPSPKGISLIIGPWNYPLQLLIAPLIGAISAGCTAFLKPSECAPATSAVIQNLISETYPEEEVAVVQGEGGIVIPAMLDARRFDHVFFTGSTRTGSLIARQAAEKLTPVTLELGGKSPVIVDHTANLKVAAKRITWGKFFNAGQTCVAPDYVLVDHSVREKLLAEMSTAISGFFGDDAATSPSYGRIINLTHWEKLHRQIADAKVLYGGRRVREDLFFEPTIVEIADRSHPLLQEEIFGPILPVIPFSNSSEIIEQVNRSPMPLAFYLFTTNRKMERELMSQVAFGGGCVNDVIAHLTNPDLPFGGIGPSGVGKYHGKFSFDEFSNLKSILKSSSWFDLPFRYPPYKDSTLGLLRKIQK